MPALGVGWNRTPQSGGSEIVLDKGRLVLGDNGLEIPSRGLEAREGSERLGTSCRPVATLEKPTVRAD